MQGVIKSYDPSSKQGVVIRDTDMSEYDLATDALEGSIFRMVRQGQRVIFELDGAGLATHVHMGSEVDMGTPGFPPRRPARPSGLNRPTLPPTRSGSPEGDDFGPWPGRHARFTMWMGMSRHWVSRLSPPFRR
ncbi:MAG TPA: hypothetical protein VF320_08135 [Acidimicrobiales bacterium]